MSSPERATGKPASRLIDQRIRDLGGWREETLARMRRSLFGNRGEAEYKLFLNPLVFTDDGCDTYLNAEHYVMLGNFDRDPDRFPNVRRVVREFLLTLNLGSKAEDDSVVDGWLNVPENAHELVGAGQPDEAVRFYTAAVSIRPRSQLALHALREALRAAGRPE